MEIILLIVSICNLIFLIGHIFLSRPAIHEIKFSVQSVKQELTTIRQDASQHAKDIRIESGIQLHSFSKTLSDSISNAAEAQKNLLDSFAEQLKAFKISMEENSCADRREQRENFSGLLESQALQCRTNTETLQRMQSGMEKSIKNLQEGNEVKLEEMRRTVDEKLEKTLETRLAQSFTLVSERLENVHKGLGEMQQLAIGVGDLKKVLSNVKTRGVLGETQLGNILEQLLAPDQYEVNVITKKGTSNRVEFAIKIPQQNQENKVLLMPVDAKFPIEDYYNLLAAYDLHDVSGVEIAGKALESAIKKAAKDIHEKYINPPDTSEIGLLFLPIEGLYAEAVRRPALLETLQREYQIIITGPTTLSAVLSAISFGYKTMAMEQRSGEIKKTLSAVRTEFNNFGTVLKRAQEKIYHAGEDIDLLVGVRTRKIQAKLKSFDELPGAETAALLGLDSGLNDSVPDLSE